MPPNPETVEQLLQRAKTSPASLTVSDYAELARLQSAQAAIARAAPARQPGQPASPRQPGQSGPPGPSVPDPDAAFFFSRDQVAALFDVTTRTVNRLVAHGEIPKPLHAPGLRSRWDARQIVRHLLARLDARDRSTLSSQDERYRAAKADLAEMERDRALGKLVEIDAVVRALAPAIVACRTGLLTLPDRLALLAPPDLRPDLSAEARSAVALLLRDLQDAFANLSPAESN